MTAAFDAIRYRMRDGHPEHRREGELRYAMMTLEDIRALPTDGAAWRWLVKVGAVTLPRSRSGPNIPESQRGTRQLLLRLPPEQIAEIRERAAEAGQTVSRYVADRALAPNAETAPQSIFEKST